MQHSNQKHRPCLLSYTISYLVHSLYIYENSAIFNIHTTKLIVILTKKLTAHSAENDLVFSKIKI